MPFTEHLQHRKWISDNLNSFAGLIAQLKKSLINLLSQQALLQPGNHAQVLANIESSLANNRAFFATNEEIAVAFLSNLKLLKQGGKASVRPVSSSYLTAGLVSYGS